MMNALGQIHPWPVVVQQVERLCHKSERAEPHPQSPAVAKTRPPWEATKVLGQPRPHFSKGKRRWPRGQATCLDLKSSCLAQSEPPQKRQKSQSWKCDPHRATRACCAAAEKERHSTTLLGMRSMIPSANRRTSRGSRSTPQLV